MRTKRCRFIPDVSVTVQNQVIDLNRLLHNMDPYLRQQFVRRGTYDAAVNLDSDPDIFTRRDFDIVDIFEYEKSINQARFFQSQVKNDGDNKDFDGNKSEPEAQTGSDPAAVSSADGSNGSRGFERK